MKHHRNNILSVYLQSTSSEQAEGHNWYQTANADAMKLHESPQVAAGVIAAISPGLKWSVNVEYARRLIVGEDTGGLGRVWPRNLAKAFDIISGIDPEVVLGRKKHSGHKVRAFYSCILNPSDWVHVCIDGHAYGIRAGERMPLDTIPSMTFRQYDEVANDYRKVADELNLLPHQVQATTWLAWRRINQIAA